MCATRSVSPTRDFYCICLADLCVCVCVRGVYDFRYLLHSRLQEENCNVVMTTNTVRKRRRSACVYVCVCVLLILPLPVMRDHSLYNSLTAEKNTILITSKTRKKDLQLPCVTSSLRIATFRQVNMP